MDKSDPGSSDICITYASEAKFVRTTKLTL
jgi:hypothetical protein